MLEALTVRGPFRGPTGYDHHTREFVRELCAQGVSVELEDVSGWSPAKLPSHMREPWLEALSKDALSKPRAARIAVHFTLPRQAFPYPDKLNVNFTMFEATRVLPEWVRANRFHHALIVPTESSQLAWMNSDYPERKIHLCPLGIDPAVFSGNIIPLELKDLALERYRVRFLNVSELGGRKNLLGLMEAWIRGTSRDDSAVLIIKLGCYNEALRQRFEDDIQKLEHRLNKRRTDAAPVHFIQEIFFDAAMPRLYSAATHYISMSYGEGWDLAMMEAGAAGLKLIAPAHSAYLAYLDAFCASLIPAVEVPAIYEGDQALAALFHGANWWRPDSDAAIAHIRAAIEGWDSDKVSPRNRILRDFTWSQATRRLIAILEEVQMF